MAGVFPILLQQLFVHSNYCFSVVKCFTFSNLRVHWWSRRRRTTGNARRRRRSPPPIVITIPSHFIFSGKFFLIFRPTLYHPPSTLSLLLLLIIQNYHFSHSKIRFKKPWCGVCVCVYAGGAVGACAFMWGWGYSNFFCPSSSSLSSVVVVFVYSIIPFSFFVYNPRE